MAGNADRTRQRASVRGYDRRLSRRIDFAQQQRIDRLEREFAALSEQLQHSLRSQGIALDPAQEVPPHY